MKRSRVSALGMCRSSLTRIRRPQSLSEILTPGSGQRGMVARVRQQRLVPGIGRVQADYVRHRQAPFVSREPFNCIAWTQLAFSLDGEIEPTAAALKETLDDVRSAKPDRQLVAGHAGLRHNEFHAAGTIAVTDPDLVFQQPLGGEVFAESAPGQFRIGQFATPKIVVLRRICVNSFFGSAVNRQVRLLVALDIETRDVHRAGDRSLEDGSLDTAAMPLHLPGPSNA